MQITTQIAKSFRAVYLGGNWTGVDFKTTLADVTWQQATTRVQSFNTIATLVFHINYYVQIIIRVLEGGPLEGNDKLSFEHSPITSHEDWQQLLDKFFSDAETCAQLMEQFPDNQLFDTFFVEKYGDYYRNLSGVGEHCHYHLGQIVLIKKMLLTKNID
jgi:DinB superfamily